MKVAIHDNKEVFTHSGLWTSEWISYCVAHSIEYDVFDFFATNAMGQLSTYDCALWHLGNYSQQEMLFARSILNSLEAMNIAVFPNSGTSWHFDDKVAQSYLLSAINAPIPDAWLFVTEPACNHWLDTEARFPIVAKLRNGSGSTNVRLFRDSSAASRYVRKMFGSGMNPTPKIAFKTISNLRSTKDTRTFRRRLARAPEFLRTRAKARSFPKERGYAYFQAFVPNSGYDLKVVVVGDKLSFIGRRVRGGDFRASGGGDLTYDRELLTTDIIESAFRTTDALGCQCMGYDYVIDSRTGTGRIVEMSYGFSFSALIDASGYWDRQGQWHDSPLNAPHDVIRNLISSIDGRSHPSPPSHSA